MHSRLPFVHVCLLALTACNGGGSTSDGGDGSVQGRKLEILTPPGLDVGLRPGEQQTLRVRYLDSSQGTISGAAVRFAIFGDPHGSTLSSDTAYSDDDGVALIQIHAGAVDARFQVRASAPGAKEVTFYVEVSAAGFGAIAVSGSYQGYLPQDKVGQLSTVTYYLYSSVGCGSFDPFNPPPSLRERQTTKLSEGFVFESLPLDRDHTLAARAHRPLGDGKLQMRAAGCVELPIGALQPCKGAKCSETDQLEVTLLLTDVWPQLVADYQVESLLILPKTNRPLADALQPWVDLTDCPLDPEQRLLDCILDARDPGDPDDCTIVKPSVGTQALMAERGSLSGGCRGGTNSHGTASLEKRLRDLTQAAGGVTRESLTKIEAKAAETLHTLVVNSTLAVQSLTGSNAPLVVVASHEVRALGFMTPTNTVSFKVPEIGVIKWLANPIKGTVAPLVAAGWDWELTLEKHSFSLPYGALTRAALGELVLAPAGLPTGSKDLVKHLADQIQTAPAIKGCGAIGATLCKAARLKPGCLAGACWLGIDLVAEALDQGFASIDGQPTDLTLEGVAQLKDSDGDLKVDGLGESGAPGTWKARLLLGKDVIVPQQALFTGTLEGGR